MQSPWSDNVAQGFEGRTLESKILAHHRSQAKRGEHVNISRLCGVVLLLTCAVAPAASGPIYRLEQVIGFKGDAPSWDYLTFDPERSYLFLGRRAAGVTVYDTQKKQAVGQIGRSEGANAATLVPEFDRGYTANADGSTTIFQLSSLKTLDRVKLGESADNAFYEPVTRQLAFTMGDSKELTFVDAKAGMVTGRLHMEAEELEGVAADGKGALFVVERDIEKIARVDAATRSVVAEWPIPGCEFPTGLALDPINGRLFIGCKGDHAVLAVMDSATGRVIAQHEIGRGNDGVVYDGETHRIYTSNGIDGNIVIYEQVDADTYRLVQAVTTRPIARTMTIDPKTKKIYTMTAEGMVDPAKKVNRRAGAFYPNTFFDDTFTLLVFAPQESGVRTGR
jgi:DNA-binding beta-propeller fold protein YncE